MITTLLIAALVSTSASASNWLDIGTGSKGTNVAINSKSFEVHTDRDGQTFRTVTFRTVNDGSANFMRFVVFDSVCTAGSGPVYVLALDSSHVEKHPYVKEGGNLITTLADIVCAVRADRVLRPDPKGMKL